MWINITNIIAASLPDSGEFQTVSQAEPGMYICKLSVYHVRIGDARTVKTGYYDKENDLNNWWKICRYNQKMKVIWIFILDFEFGLDLIQIIITQAVINFPLNFCNQTQNKTQIFPYLNIKTSQISRKPNLPDWSDQRFGNRKCVPYEKCWLSCAIFLNEWHYNKIHPAEDISSNSALCSL